MNTDLHSLRGTSIPSERVPHTSPALSRETKVAVIREEFVALTKDPMTAIVLNQLVYWTERVKDFDFFLAEEKTINPGCNVHPRHGWIYKSAEELSEETMIQVSQTTMRRYLQSLISAGWIDKRSNAENKWDKTVQYRVNLRKLQEDLAVLGYALPGKSLSIHSFQKSESFLSDVSNGVSNVQNGASNVQNGASNVQNERSISETTSEIKEESSSSSSFSCNSAREKNPEKGDEEEEENFFLELNEGKSNERESFEEIPSQSMALSETFSPETLPLKMLEVWKKKIGQPWIQMTDERKQGLSLLLSDHLQDDLSAWEGLCDQIKSSRFLMGEGTSGWKISLDWLLKPANLCKVLEGKFYDQKPKEDTSQVPYALGSPGIKDLSLERKSEIQATLSKIKDPTWKIWCSHLPFNPHFAGYVMPWKLEAIVNARFVGVDDDGLAWISAPDSQVITRIEDLRFQLLTIVQRTYPKVRAIRTCLTGESPFNGSPLNGTPLKGSQLNETPLNGNPNSSLLSSPPSGKLSQVMTKINTPFSHCPSPSTQSLGDSHVY